jgi:hypothetical protein
MKNKANLHFLVTIADHLLGEKKPWNIGDRSIFALCLPLAKTQTCKKKKNKNNKKQQKQLTLNRKMRPYVSLLST